MFLSLLTLSEGSGFESCPIETVVVQLNEKIRM
jgi:hypothetical protein